MHIDAILRTSLLWKKNHSQISCHQPHAFLWARHEALNLAAGITVNRDVRVCAAAHERMEWAALFLKKHVLNFARIELRYTFDFAGRSDLAY